MRPGPRNIFCFIEKPINREAIQGQRLANEISWKID